MAKRKPIRRRAAPALRQVDVSQIVLSPSSIKWILSVLGTLVAFVIGYWTLWDRVQASLDARWRLESVQQAKDREQEAHYARIDAAIKAERTQSEAELKALAKRAEQGRAWVLWSVIDSRALNTEQFAVICNSLKRPGEVCLKFERDAMQYRQEAQEAKRAAQEAGK